MTDRGGRITVTVQRLLGQPPKPLPIALAGIAADAIYNLRAALDQAGYAVAVAAKTSGKNAHFPFGDTLEEVKSREQGGSKEIPKSIFDAMVALRPFETGNTFL